MLQLHLPRLGPQTLPSPPRCLRPLTLPFPRRRFRLEGISMKVRQVKGGCKRLRLLWRTVSTEKDSTDTLAKNSADGGQTQLYACMRPEPQNEHRMERMFLHSPFSPPRRFAQRKHTHTHSPVHTWHHLSMLARRASYGRSVTAPRLRPPRRATPPSPTSRPSIPKRNGTVTMRPMLDGHLIDTRLYFLSSPSWSRHGCVSQTPGRSPSG